MLKGKSNEDPSVPWWMSHLGSPVEAYVQARLRIDDNTDSPSHASLLHSADYWLLEEQTIRKPLWKSGCSTNLQLLSIKRFELGVLADAANLTVLEDISTDIQADIPGNINNTHIHGRFNQIIPTEIPLVPRNPIGLMGLSSTPSTIREVPNGSSSHGKYETIELVSSKKSSCLAAQRPLENSTYSASNSASLKETKEDQFKKRPRKTIYGKDDLQEESLSESSKGGVSGFVSAYDKFEEEAVKSNGASLPPPSDSNSKKRKRFQSPFLEDQTTSMNEETAGQAAVKKPKTDSKPVQLTEKKPEEEYKGVDPEIAARVLNEILDINLNVKWSDIAGLEDVKQILREMIILPNLHPTMFTGLRAPPRGLLLFGPPGNGKTMIAKAIATESGLTFFSISASVLCSKWIGEGEKTMRALFTIARAKAPSFIFIDEIDSILCTRSSEEHESSRRLKNEFLLQFDGAISSSEDAVTVMGATNRPFDLDDAARRRLPKRIYVPLPELVTRVNLLSHLLKGEAHSLAETEINNIAKLLEGYSCSDIHQISQQAAMGPVREKVRAGDMNGILRPIQVADFELAINVTRPSVAPEDCKLYEEFSQKFGTRGI